MSSPAPHQAPSSSLVSTSPSREPQTIVSVVGHQSDTTETPVSCVDQDSVSAADCISVFQAFFSLVRKCVCYGQFSSELLMSPKRLAVSPVPTTVERHRNHHKRRLTNVAVPARITSPKLQQPYSRAFVRKPLPPLLQSRLQNLTVPRKPLEILAGETIRTVQADGGEEESETVTEHEDRHQDVASRRGTMSCRRRAWSRQDIGHLMRCSSSATSASLLEHSALRTVATRKLFPQTLGHFQTFVAKRN